MQDTDRDLLPEGLEDRLPQDAAAAARVTRAMLDAMDRHGYDRVQPPSIEFEKSMASRMAGVQPRRRMAASPSTASAAATAGQLPHRA